MSEPTGEASKYQQMLQEQDRLRRQGGDSHDRQQNLAPGSSQREQQGKATEQVWDQLGKTTEKLIEAGIVDGYGRLTDKARKLGIG